MQMKQKRWMKSVIEASKAEQAPLPFQRGKRRTLTRRDGATLHKAA